MTALEYLLLMLWQHPDYYVTYILQQNGGSNAATDICDGGSLRPVRIPDQSNAHWKGAKAAKLKHWRHIKD